MKKIFAFVLASLMVLSLVPASAFAAVTKCPATHTSTNCDATLLYTAVADCENVGYQAYVCNDCGAQFMDNLKPKTNHAWVSDTEKAAGNIAANCIYKTNGIEYLVCKNCEVGYIVDGVEVGYKTVSYNSVDVHDLELVSGVGCEKLYQCTLCDAKGYIDAENAILTTEVSHNWKFVEVEVEPKWENGTAKKGTAVYACDDCVATKKVDINTPACANDAHDATHEDATIVQKAKDATCTAKGAYLVVKCSDCGKTWYCSSKTCASTHKEDEDHTWSALKDNKTSNLPKHDALGHYDENGVKNGDTNECGKAYYCVVCYTWQTQGHDYAALKDADGNDLIVNPTCTTDGYQYRQCKDCGTINKETKKKTDHKKSDWITVPATCASPAIQYKKCTNANCTIVPTVIGGVAVKVVEGPKVIGNANANAHNFATIEGMQGIVNIGNVNPDLYCSGITYEYKICTNGCAEYGNGKAVMSDPVLHDFYVSSSAHNFSKSAGNFNAFSSYVVYTCKKCNKSLTGKTIADTEIYKTTFNSKEEALEFFGYIKRNFTYVDGEVVELAPALRVDFASFGTVDAVFEAKFVYMAGSLSTNASCQTAASTTYAVPDYGTYVTILGTKTPHVPGQTIPGKDATCVLPGTHTTYVCKNCGVTYWQDATGKQYTTSAIKNPCFDDVEFVSGTCGEENGYWECTKCHTCYTDATCSTKYVPAPHNYVTLLAGVAATCNTTGLPEIRYCSICKALEINVIYMNGGNELRVNFNESDVKYMDSDITVTISTSFLSAEVDVTVTADGSIFFDYADDVWTNWPTAVNVKKMEGDNNHRGLYNKVPAEVEAVDAEDEVTYVAGDVLLSGIVLASEVMWDNSEIDADTDFEELDHTKPFFTLVYCEACVYEYIKGYQAAAGGHINNKGNIITDDCADGAKGDRECVICKAYYQDLAEDEGEAADFYKDYYTFGAHTLVDVPSASGFNSVWNDEFDTVYTCQTSGYKAQLCTTCNLYIVDADSYEPANADKFHKNLKDAIAADDYTAKYKCQRGPVADYAQNGNSYYACYVCEAQLTTAKPTPCPGVGLEINMSTEYDEYMPNSYIELVISLDSLKGVNAWGLNFSVGYNPNAVKFVSADFSASPFGTNVANAVTGPTYTLSETTGMPVASPAKVPYGVVSVASSSTAGVELKGNNEYAVLVFQVIESGYDVAFEIGYVQPFQADENNTDDPLNAIWYKANAVGANGKAIKVNYNVTVERKGDFIIPGTAVNKTWDVTTLTFLDLDENGELDIFDAFELYYLIETDVYSVLADADHDGDVDTDDLDILYAVLVGDKTLKDILAEGEAEEEERVIKYDEEGFVVYDSLYDFNDDGVLSAYEIAVMTGKIDADLNPNT